MKNRIGFIGSMLLALFLALVPAASAGNTWYVDGVNGNDNNNCKTRQTACKTISHAISLASSGDTIGVGPATYTENPTIGFSLRIIGSGAATTIVDGGGGGTVLTINSPAQVTLSKLTIRNGYSSYQGGGIWNGGTLTINNSTITGNTVNSNWGGGGIFNEGILTINYSTISGNSGYGGGGILTLTTMTINNSTFSSNSAWGYGGGGIYIAGGPVTVDNSTFSGNSTTGFGGGIFTFTTLTINNSTFSGNSSTENDGGAILTEGGAVAINNSTFSGNTAPAGGGIVALNYGETVILQNSVVANSSGGNCSGTMTSNGYNLSSDGSCNFDGPGDLNNTNPRLQPLGNYGGPTQTMAVFAGSPAIDAGNPNGCTDSNGNLLKTDQRGAPRPGPYDHHGCDMGAFENQEH